MFTLRYLNFFLVKFCYIIIKKLYLKPSQVIPLNGYDSKIDELYQRLIKLRVLDKFSGNTNYYGSIIIKE